MEKENLVARARRFFRNQAELRQLKRENRQGAENEFCQVVQGNSLGKDAWRRLKKNKAAVFGMCVVLLYALVALCAGILPIYSYEEIILDHQYLPPSLTKTAGELMMRRKLSEIYATAWRQRRLQVTEEENAVLEGWIKDDKTPKVWDWCYEEGERQREAGAFAFSKMEQKKVDHLVESIKTDIQVTLKDIRWTGGGNGKAARLSSLGLDELAGIYGKALGVDDLETVRAGLATGVENQIRTQVKTKNAESGLTDEDLSNLVAMELDSLGEEKLEERQASLAVDNIKALLKSEAEVKVKAMIAAGEAPEFPFKESLQLFDDLSVKVQASLKNQRRYLLGTDNLGRDLLSRIVYGGRISIMIGLVGTVTSLLIGIVMGSLAGYVGGRVDYYIMRFVDVLYGLPYMLLVIICMAIFGTNILNLFFALAMVSWLTIARMVRGQIMSLKNQEYIEAARSMGAGGARIVFRHLVPNSLSVIIVYSTLRIPEFIMQESFLSFLGLGVQAPLASWGSLIGDSTQGMTQYPWRLIYPAIVMTLFLFSMNFFGDGLRDAFDPQSKNML